MVGGRDVIKLSHSDLEVVSDETINEEPGDTVKQTKAGSKLKLTRLLRMEYAKKHLREDLE
jgi:hypothetical protein